MKFKNPLNNKLKEKIKSDDKIMAVIVFGSYARQENYNDIDVCLVLDKKYSNLLMSKKRLEYSCFSDKFDFHIFQQLPIYIRTRILKEGKIILSKDLEFLYELAFSTIKEFEFYKKIYYNYLNTIKIK